jgi:sorting nexin-29
MPYIFLTSLISPFCMHSFPRGYIWHGRESIIIRTFENGDRIDCKNYRGVSLLPTTDKILSSILVSKLNSYVDEIIVVLQCGFRHSKPATDKIFCTLQIMDEKWEFSGTVYKLLIDFEKTCDCVRREVLYSIVIEFGIPMKLFRIFKTRLN